MFDRLIANAAIALCIFIAIMTFSSHLDAWIYKFTIMGLCVCTVLLIDVLFIATQ